MNFASNQLTLYLGMRNALILLTLIFVSCSGVEFTNADLVGTWKVVDYSLRSSPLAENLQEIGKQEAMSRVFTFTEEGTVKETSSTYPEGRDGTWTLTESKSLTLKFTNEKTYEFKAFTKKAIRLKEDMGENGKQIFDLDKE
jgi:hypothetical protein